MNRVGIGNWKGREEATVIPDVETRPIVNRCSIHLVIVLRVVGSVDRRNQPSFAKSRSVIHVSTGARGHGDQVHIIAGTQRKRCDGSRADYVAQGGAGCLNNFCVGLHRDRLRFRTHAQTAIQHRGFSHIDLDRRHLDNTEA